MWEEHQVAGKHKPPPLTIPPHPQSSLYFSTGGGAATPQHAPPPIAAPPQPETEPQKLGFGFFGPPAAWLAFRECTTPPPPLPHTHHHHTPTQRPPSCFHAAQPKPSYSSSVSDFGPTTCSLPPVSRTRDPTTTTTSYRPPPHPYAISSVAVSYGTTETEPQRLSFGLLSKTHSVARVLRTHDPTATTTSYAPPPHPYATSPVAFSCGATETEPQRLGFGFSPQTHSLPRIS